MLLVASLCLLLAPPAVAKTKVAVVDFAGAGVDAATARAVVQAVTAVVAEDESLEIITQADVANLLALERQQQLLGCDDGRPSCLAEIGGALGVERLVAGSVSALGGSFLLTAQLLDVPRARVMRRASRKAGSADRLLDAAQALGRELRVGEPDGPAPAPAHRFGVRAGLGGHTGILGLGVEYRRGRFALALGSGRYVLTGGGSFYLRAAGGPYLDVHVAWSRAGLLGPVGAPGIGIGLTGGWELRPLPWLSLKAGAGAAWNSAMADAPKPRFLVADLSAGVLF